MLYDMIHWNPEQAQLQIVCTHIPNIPFEPLLSAWGSGLKAGYRQKS